LAANARSIRGFEEDTVECGVQKHEALEKIMTKTAALFRRVFLVQGVFTDLLEIVLI
jgi:hypothetical protein